VANTIYGIIYRAGGAKAMSNTTKDTAVKGTKVDRQDPAQRKLVRAAPPSTKHTALPPEELKYLRAEMRLG